MGICRLTIACLPLIHSIRGKKRKNNRTKSDSETFWADSEAFFVGFRNFFRRIQKLFSLDSPPLPNTDATQDLGQGSGGVGWDDNVPWP